MLPDTQVSYRVKSRLLSIILVIAVFAACVLFPLPVAFANFNSESTDQVIGVGRIQSTSSPYTDQLTGATHFVAPQPLVIEPTETVNQLAQPLDRGIENPESAIEAIGMIQMFGEPDENGWFTVLTSAYGPSSAGDTSALGTPVTLTSMDIGCHINHWDLFRGRYVDLMYNGLILRCRVVDTGEMASDGRLFDLQPGVCTYFGAETPEFGWNLRFVKWRFAD